MNATSPLTETPLSSSPEQRFLNVKDAALRASQALIDKQSSDGHWCFELEADCTIPAEYIMMMHFMDEIDKPLQTKISNYLRHNQNPDGSWPLYRGGAIDLSCTVKSYFALKLAGDDIDAPHMQLARQKILDAGGAARVNVFTRIALALFEQVPWRAVPYIPPEIMLLPRWFPFHINKVAYWSRTVMVPLFVIYAYKPKAKNPNRVNIRELFTKAPELEKNYFEVRSPLNRALLVLERSARLLAEPVIPNMTRQRALKQAERWFTERLNGEDGLGAIFPAMVNACIALDCLGYSKNHQARATCKRSIEKLLIEYDDMAYCQPCVSPVWDTGWAALALMHAEAPGTKNTINSALGWLADRQLTKESGDWKVNAPDLSPGGWAFQYANDHYPDLDDTAMVAALMHVADTDNRYAANVEMAVDWLMGLQCKNGGFAAFDVNNTFYYLNSIPFADHGALLDPPTEDVSGRVLLPLGLLKRPQDKAAINACVEYLKRQQLEDGSWWGRWGTNYIYGTWSALAGLMFVNEDPRQDYIQNAIQYLLRCQRADGGWGETNDTYEDSTLSGQAGFSAACFTAWALLALLVTGNVHHPATRRGIQWLLDNQNENGLWSDPWHNAPGFPRVFYLKYYGYSEYFPTWVLNRYRHLSTQ